MGIGQIRDFSSTIRNLISADIADLRSYKKHSNRLISA